MYGGQEKTNVLRFEAATHTAKNIDQEESGSQAILGYATHLFLRDFMSHKHHPPVAAREVCAGAYQE